MQLTGRTTVVGIFGDPVAHSLSPKMQNAAIQAAGLDAVYVPFHVTSAQLCDAIRGLRSLGIRGVNLTIPHKETALGLLDAVDDQARLAGAVNTVVNEGGRLTGYNTDGRGLLRALKQELDRDPRGRRILLIGAGGACRAAVAALCQAGAGWIGIANRTEQRAKDLIEEMKSHFPGTSFAVYPLSDSLLKENRATADILINTSAVGLKGGSFGIPVTDCVRPGGAVYDMVYDAESTALVRLARDAGLVAADGLSMLIGQGELAFEYWFGKAPEAGAMRRALSGDVEN